MRHKFSHEHNVEHNRSKISALHPKIIKAQQSAAGACNYANLAIKNDKIVYDELWHNCSSYGHNIEHNR